MDKIQIIQGWMGRDLLGLFMGSRGGGGGDVFIASIVIKIKVSSTTGLFWALFVIA